MTSPPPDSTSSAFDAAVNMHENVTVAKPENRLRYYSEAEKFLAKHLGGRFEP